MLNKQEIALLTQNTIASKAACHEVLQNFQPFVANLDAQDTAFLLAKRGEDTLARWIPSLRASPEYWWWQLLIEQHLHYFAWGLKPNWTLAVTSNLWVAGALWILRQPPTTEGDDKRRKGIRLKQFNSGSLEWWKGIESVQWTGRCSTRCHYHSCWSSLKTVYGTPYHVMALSSVIGRPVDSVYPDLESCARMRSSIHREFFPRQMFQSEEDSFHMPPPVHTMWTTCSPKTWIHGNQTTSTPLDN